MQNPEQYRWIRAIDPSDPERKKTIGEPKPCAPGQVAWATVNGYRALEQDEERAHIAFLKGEGPAPGSGVEPEKEPPAEAPKTAPGVKTSVNTAATAKKKKAEDPPAAE